MARTRSTLWIVRLCCGLLALDAYGAAGQKRVQYQQVVYPAVPSIHLSSPTSNISYGTPLSLTAVLAGKGAPPSGSVNFLSGSTLLGSSWLNAAGETTYTAALLPAGEDTITALYSGDANYSPAASAQVKISVVGVAPSITITPSALTIATAQPLTVRVTVNGGTGNPAPTGMVQLTSGNYASPLSTLITGSATIAVPAGSLAVGKDILTVTYFPDTASSAIYSPATLRSQVTVNLGTPGFTISTAPLKLAPGEIAENTSVITSLQRKALAALSHLQPRLHRFQRTHRTCRR